MLLLPYFLLLVQKHVLADLVVLKDIKGNDKLSSFWSVENGICSTSSWTFLNNYHATCYSGTDNNLPQNCTLKTLSYDVADANLVYINIEGQTRSCKSQLTTNPKCQETFNAYAEIKNNEAEDSNSKFIWKIASLRLPLTERLKNNGANDSKLKFIAKVPLLRVPLTEKFNHKNETYSVKTDGFKLISFNFRSEYYCGSIKTFNVFYYKCQGLSNSLIDFTSVAAPAEGTKQFPGKCTSNAVPVDSIPVSLNCKFDGTSVVAGSCICSPGHTKEGNKCTPCKTTEFKAAAGNEECSKCGNFSTGVLTFCACHQGYNRAADEKDDSSKPCHSSPPFTGKMPSPTSEESTLLVMIILSVLLVIFGVAFFALLCFFCRVKTKLVKIKKSPLYNDINYIQTSNYADLLNQDQTNNDQNTNINEVQSDRNRLDTNTMYDDVMNYEVIPLNYEVAPSNYEVAPESIE